jgi:hypothetical protein
VSTKVLTKPKKKKRTFQLSQRDDINQTPLSMNLSGMEINDTFIVKSDVQLMRVNVSAWGRRHNKRFSITRWGKQHICKRIA